MFQIIKGAASEPRWELVLLDMRGKIFQLNVTCTGMETNVSVIAQNGGTDLTRISMNVCVSYSVLFWITIIHEQLI